MSYDMIDRFLRNNLGDDDYAEYSAALDSLCTPQPKETEQEPVAWEGDCVLGHCGSPAGCEASNCCRADSTTPPQRKPLTDEQIETIWHDFHDREFGYAIRFARAIEAAHNIKE